VNDLTAIFKFVAAASGATSIKLRSGVYGVDQAPLAHLAPYLATYVNTMSRIIFARECIDCIVEEGSSPVSFRYFGGVLSPSALSAVLLDVFEKTILHDVLDLRYIEDLAISSEGSEDLTPVVNEMLLQSYSEFICVELANELEVTIEQLVTIEKVNEAILNV
jgi:hypothetical protein